MKRQDSTGRTSAMPRLGAAPCLPIASVDQHSRPHEPLRHKRRPSLRLSLVVVEGLVAIFGFAFRRRAALAMQTQAPQSQSWSTTTHKPRPTY